jgi:hypothetical protein
LSRPKRSRNEAVEPYEEEEGGKRMIEFKAEVSASWIN